MSNEQTIAANQVERFSINKDELESMLKKIKTDK